VDFAMSLSFFPTCYIRYLPYPRWSLLSLRRQVHRDRYYLYIYKSRSDEAWMCADQVMQGFAKVVRLLEASNDGVNTSRGY